MGGAVRGTEVYRGRELTALYRSIHILLICRISLHTTINTADFNLLFVGNDLHGLLKIYNGAVLEASQIVFFFIWVLEELLVEHFDSDA